jgi:hypothetical protein
MSLVIIASLPWNLLESNVSFELSRCKNSKRDRECERESV